MRMPPSPTTATRSGRRGAPRRGRPRSDRAREAILAATLGELTEHGFLGLGIEAIAQRAGVAKTTIYRWWPDKIALALDALRHLPELPESDTGSLVGDLDLLRRDLLDLLVSTSLGSVLPVLIAERRCRSEHQGAIDDYMRERAMPWTRAVQRAIVRGELPPDVDAEFVALLLAGPLTHSILFMEEPLDEQAWADAIAVTLAGIRAQGRYP
jgi:AcrR family transcriptional regulator